MSEELSECRGFEPHVGSFFLDPEADPLHPTQLGVELLVSVRKGQ